MELLSVSNDEELNYFFKKLIRKAARGVRKIRKIARGPRLRSVFRVLKPIAKKILPIAAGAAGTALGGPVGGMLGGRLGSVLSGLFEVDPQGLADDELEFETARRFVRLAGSTIQEALKTPASVSAGKAAQQALKSSAMKANACRRRAGPGRGKIGSMDSPWA
jgi:hypothetical protein